MLIKIINESYNMLGFSFLNPGFSLLSNSFVKNYIGNRNILILSPSVKSLHLPINYFFLTLFCFTLLMKIVRFSILKYQRGRRPRGERWVLGLFDTQYQPARPYLQLVRRRNAATLLPIIQRKVQPGSVVHTDE